MKTVKAAGQLSPRSAQRDEHCRTGCARSLERGTLAYKISPSCYKPDHVIDRRRTSLVRAIHGIPL
jgi:hypothetical protein